MTNTINNVPRELKPVLAMILNALDRDAADGKQARAEMAAELRALLSAPSPADHVEDVRAMVAAPSPAGVDGLRVIGWYTEDHLDDKSATTYSREVADRWLAKGWPITGIANAADAQAIIDGLRGEIEALHAQVKVLQSDANSWQSGYDEGRRTGGKHCALTIDQQAQRIGELEQILRDLVPGCKWRFMRPRIDAALSAGKEGE